MGLPFRGGGPGFDDTTSVPPMAQAPPQYAPNTVQWGGRQGSVPTPPGATNAMQNVPSSAQIGTPNTQSPVVSVFPPARSKG